LGYNPGRDLRLTEGLTEPRYGGPRPTGVILAGGLGTRMRGVLPDTAKPLAAVQGRPFLTFLLSQLERAGIGRIILCTGHRGDQVRAAIGESFDGVPIEYSVEDQPLGTGGALRLAVQRYGDGQTWMVMNGDSLVDINLCHLYSEHQRAGLAATIAAVAVPDGRRYGTLECSADGRIVAFREKSEDPRPVWINAGVYLLEPLFLEALPSAVPLSLEREVFPEWICRGLHVSQHHARFIDIGTPESYALAQEFFR